MVSEQTPDITDEFANRICLAVSDPGAFLKRGDDYTEPIYRWSARAVQQVISEWLAGRAVVALPDPKERDEEDDPLWIIPGGGQIVACVIEGQPFVVSDPPGFRPLADRVEKYALALLAAAREARRLADAQPHKPAEENQP